MSGSDPTGAGNSAAATVEGCCAAGREALARGALAEAQAWAERCRSLPGGEADARCVAFSGAVAADQGDLEGALAHFRRAAGLAPADAAIAQELAETLEESGALPEAISVLESAAGHAADPAPLLVDLGYLRLEAGDNPGAREALERAASLRSGDPAIERALAQLYEAVGEPALAAERLAGAARAAPSAAALHDLARLNLQLERYAEAGAAFRRLALVDPDHELFARHGETWCYLKRSDWRGALEVALGAARLDRFDLTTAFLAYARDRLFTHIPDAAQHEAELGKRFYEEMSAHAELHGGE
jgi:tetratricopeptide (TPR) repeat protein